MKFYVKILNTGRTADDYPSCRYNRTLYLVQYFYGSDLRYERDYLEIPALEIAEWVKQC